MIRFLARCKKHLVIFIIDLVALLCCIPLLCAENSIKEKAYSQQEGSRWNTKDVVSHQVSAFWPSSTGINRAQISGIRASIQKSMLDASFGEDRNGDALWTDAYAAMTTDSVTIMKQGIGTSGKENVRILGVGGDFFLFHPLDMMYGSVFRPEDVMHDRIVLDKETAWELFGGYDIAGMRVEIAGKPFLVAGVYEMPENSFSKKATDGRSFVFIDHSAFQNLYQEIPITCYEAVLPNPVRSFAKDRLQDATGGENSDAVILDNESRFTGRDLFARFSDIEQLLMQKNAVVYPYWENEMRAREWRVFILMMIRFLFLMPPLVSLIFALWSLIRRYGKDILRKVWYDAKERIRRLSEKKIRQRVSFEDEDF
ncbi:MAG: ABC transporter permease [Lachnospiraceae bacterium]|nr:ABC transporter permease [Lachnospiraceae bacterium]